MAAELNVEGALRMVRNGTALLSWVMEMAEENEPPAYALEGAGDVCEDMLDLAERLKATFENRILKLELAECDGEEPEAAEGAGAVTESEAGLASELEEQVRRLDGLVRRLKSEARVVPHPAGRLKGAAEE